GVLALPWVKDVEVTKEWPGTVTLKVSERVPVAGVRAIGSGWMLVDQEGHQLEVIPDMVPGVVPVEGTMPVGKPGKIVESDGLAALALVEALDPTLRASVMRVVFSEGPSLGAVLRPGEGGEEVEVRFGSPVDLKMKAVDLSTILANVDIRDIAVLDVRVPGTPAVIRRR
ncbi:MAG: cell division protein FtsQ/DivIB, partial [Acidimicrobiales bacterium]